jgi:hypothetical protein
MHGRRQQTELPLPTPDEQLVAEKILGACMHRHWTRSFEPYGQFAVCVSCGKRLYLSGNFAPDLTDTAVSTLWLRQLPRPASDDATASTVVRKLEAQGWSVKIAQSGAITTCVVEKEGARFESSSHNMRAAAINEAAAKSAGGKCSG